MFGWVGVCVCDGDLSLVDEHLCLVQNDSSSMSGSISNLGRWKFLQWNIGQPLPAGIIDNTEQDDPGVWLSRRPASYLKNWSHSSLGGGHGKRCLKEASSPNVSVIVYFHTTHGFFWGGGRELGKGSWTMGPIWIDTSYKVNLEIPI